jgi:hypothetical protein
MHPSCLAQIKRSIGRQAVEDNVALFEETTALADILGEVQLSTDAFRDRQKLLSNPQRGLVRGQAAIAWRYAPGCLRSDPKGLDPPHSRTLCRWRARSLC